LEELLASAKINLRLVVTGRRSDGYHHLSMLNACTTLADKLWVTLTSDGNISLEECSSGATRLPEDSARPETNLASKAAAAFVRRFAPGTGVRIKIEKNIPSGAGLGGGSSDAAAVLRYLWRSCRHQGTPRELYEAAAGLGADVPYLLYGGMAVVRGVGEKLAPLGEPTTNGDVRAAPTKPVALVLPPWSIPTPALFAEYRRQHPRLPEQAEEDSELRHALTKRCSWNEVLDLVRNDLEGSISSFSPQSAAALKALREVPQLVTSVTGSGSAMFSLAPESLTPEEQRSAFKSLEVVAERLGCRMMMVQVKWGPFLDGIVPPE
jgi:4-diphosphocytidyl-2-C-methyl-D-erythritol kinase